jgi:hypothetical protein
MVLIDGEWTRGTSGSAKSDVVYELRMYMTRTDFSPAI